jgi:hypothetical protein
MMATKRTVDQKMEEKSNNGLGIFVLDSNRLVLSKLNNKTEILNT